MLGSDTRSYGPCHALHSLGFLVADADILAEEIVAVVAEAAIAAAVVETAEAAATDTDYYYFY